MSANARIIKNAIVYVDDYDMSGDENEVNLLVTSDAKESTVMDNTAHVFKPGLTALELALLGFNSYGEGQLDEKAWSLRGTELVPVSVIPEGATQGNRAWILRSTQMGYDPRIIVGELPTFRLLIKSNASPLVGGLLQLPATVVSSFPYTQTGYQAGAITADQHGYANLHVLSITGSGTLTVKLQSSTTQGGSYTDRITFTNLTAAGSEWKSVAGAITDTWWRVYASQTGSITQAVLVVTFGIQT
jgi:hypothetical protein